MVLLLIYSLLVLGALFVFLFRRLVQRKADIAGKHVVITGGSSGIGLAIAQQFLDRGAKRVSLVARSRAGLDKAVQSLKYSNEQYVEGFTADVSDFESLQLAFEKIKEACPTIDFLFANAGFAKPGLLKESTDKDILQHINVNYLGAAYATKLAYPMLHAGSHVTYSGSFCSILSFAGYIGYSPAKYALRGLADTLRNEFKHDKINVHMLIMSSVDTPGFKVENEFKPKVCADIEGTAQTFTPEEIAIKVVHGIDQGDYLITTEPLAWVALQLTYGVAPCENFFAQMLIAPLLPIIRYLAVKYIDYLAANPKSKDEEDAKTK